MLLCYQLSDEEAQNLHQVRAHDVWAFAASKAFQGGVSLDEILSACHWKAHNALTQFYLKTWLGQTQSYISRSCCICPTSPGVIPDQYTYMFIVYILKKKCSYSSINLLEPFSSFLFITVHSGQVLYKQKWGRRRYRTGPVNVPIALFTHFKVQRSREISLIGYPPSNG